MMMIHARHLFTHLTYASSQFDIPTNEDSVCLAVYTKDCISATYYLELRNAKIIHYVSLFSFFANKGRIGCLHVLEH